MSANSKTGQTRNLDNFNYETKQNIVHSTKNSHSKKFLTYYNKNITPKLTNKKDTFFYKF